ncbi:MAG TPA: 5'/3'-nucleotidase SurE [Candidatus Fermentibacter sp.]|nr:5'/3'-nucleotidase SurE [Candidatus Fermentibacter sp.]
MRILVTNDDGIDAEGLDVLVRSLSRIETREGRPHEITVVAPDTERSGTSHSVTLKHPTRLRKLSEGRYSCSGSPADCVIVAGLSIYRSVPDLLISGINRGPNLGTDIVYSGTCGAARQAALSDVPSIAVSCASFVEPLDYECCADFVAMNLEALAAAWKPGSFVNVNGPSTDRRDIMAVWTEPGRNKYYDALRCFEGADGFTYCFLADGRHERSGEGMTDHRAVADGLISVGLIDLHPRRAEPSPAAGSPFYRNIEGLDSAATLRV